MWEVVVTLPIINGLPGQSCDHLFIMHTIGLLGTIYHESFEAESCTASCTRTPSQKTFAESLILSLKSIFEWCHLELSYTKFHGHAKNVKTTNFSASKLSWYTVHIKTTQCIRKTNINLQINRNLPHTTNLIIINCTLMSTLLVITCMFYPVAIFVACFKSKLKK